MIKNVVVIGCGPRGISILERLAVLLSSDNNNSNCNNITISIIDNVQLGGGRIWRKDQREWFLMNTPARETTIFSGESDKRGVRPGFGPPLSQWWVDTDPVNAEPDGLAPRYVYGEYLSFAFEKIVDQLSKFATVNLITDTAIDLEKIDDSNWKVFLKNHNYLIADKVILTTGHSLANLERQHLEFQNIAATSNNELDYVRGDSVVDMNLNNIKPASSVGIIGCGLSFFDLMASLTEGRGGNFVIKDDGTYDYIPSGLEPILFVGSRSGVPLPSRAFNEKSADYSYKPLILNKQRIEKLRNLKSHSKLDFEEDILPWLEAEMQLVQMHCIIKNTQKENLLNDFTNEVINNIDNTTSLPKNTIIEIANKFGIKPSAIVDLYQWSRPFCNTTFSHHNEYINELKNWITSDIMHANIGNMSDPIKATMDALRDMRGIIKIAVDFAGLTPQSHENYFLKKFIPAHSMLCAGPPVHRLKQVLALMDKNLLTFVGPNAQFTYAENKKSYLISSPQIADAEFYVKTLVDARIPSPNLRTNESPLIKNLFNKKTLTSFNNTLDDCNFNTGGVAVTQSPFHPISADGIEKNLYILGIPVENTRWLMHVGSGRPGVWGQFTSDADAIAKDIMLNLV